VTSASREATSEEMVERSERTVEASRLVRGRAEINDPEKRRGRRSCFMILSYLSLFLPFFFLIELESDILSIPRYQMGDPSNI
jgi:hypothetical protein